MMQGILYFLGGAALLLLIVQGVVMVHARKQRGRELENLGGAMGEAVRTGDRVVAYFHSPSSAVCRTQTPIIEKLAAEYENIFTLDITQEFEVARAIGIRVTPTIVIIEGGEIRDFLVGARSEDMLREALL